METEKFIHQLEAESEEGAAKGFLNSVVLEPSKKSPRPLPTAPIINAETFSQTNISIAMQSSKSFIPPPGSEGLILVMNIVCPFLHTVRYPSTKLTALELFLLFAKYLDSGGNMMVDLIG